MSRAASNGPSAGWARIGYRCLHLSWAIIGLHRAVQRRRATHIRLLTDTDAGYGRIPTSMPPEVRPATRAVINTVSDQC